MAEEELKSYSQAYQDAFAIACNGWKANGTFVDLGAGDPVAGSNTFALEERGWSGLVADIATENELRAHRIRSNVYGDAFDPAVDEEIRRHSVIDFLSLDLEPPELTLRRLASLPLGRVKFKVACVEHDLYRGNESIRAAMRGILEWHGYRMAAADVRMLAESEDGLVLVPVEDWWIHPQFVSLSAAIDFAGVLRGKYESEAFEKIAFLERCKAQPEEVA